MEYLLARVFHFQECPASFSLDTLQVPAGYHTFTHNNALGVGEFWKQAPLDTVLGGNLTHNKMLHESYKKTIWHNTNTLYIGWNFILESSILL